MQIYHKTGLVTFISRRLLNEKNPVEVTTQYYAKYCTIPEEKWLDSFESPALSKYFNSIKEKYPRK